MNSINLISNTVGDNYNFIVFIKLKQHAILIKRIIVPVVTIDSNCTREKRA